MTPAEQAKVQAKKQKALGTVDQFERPEVLEDGFLSAMDAVSSAATCLDYFSSLFPEVWFELLTLWVWTSFTLWNISIHLAASLYFPQVHEY